MFRFQNLLPKLSGSQFFSFRTYGMMLLVVLMATGTVACKGKKKVVETPSPVVEDNSAAEAQIAKVKAELQALLTDKVTPLEERERRLAEIKALNIQNAEIQALIRQVEDALRAERDRLEAEKREQEAAADVKNKLGNLFQSISSATTPAQADAQINNALRLFASPQVPVLIVIHQANGQKDYDRPTDITRYVQYLKDTRQNFNEVSNIVYDANGKITELELIKRK